MTESQFRQLSTQYGSPDDIPCDLLPEKIAAALSMADRFFDQPSDTDASVALLSEHFNQ